MSASPERKTHGIVLSVRLEGATVKRLQRMADERGMLVSQLARQILDSAGPQHTETTGMLGMNVRV